MEFSLHLLLLMVTPPLFLGVIAKVKAFFAGRKGPPMLQPYYDLIRLFQKGMIWSKSASFIFKFAPVGVLVCILMSGLFIPFIGQAPFRLDGDVILFAYFLATARFLIILAAMDVGSSFEGMGASREATLGAFSELAFFLGLIALVVMTQSFSLSGIFEWEGKHTFWNPAILMLFMAFFVVLLTENARIPIDDPATHLELTMIHEAMILEYSGPNLALMLYGASIKLFIFMALTVSILWPTQEVEPIKAILWFFVKMFGMAVGIGLVESMNARLRLIKIPQLLVANFVITALALMLIVMGGSA